MDLPSDRRTGPFLLVAPPLDMFNSLLLPLPAQLALDVIIVIQIIVNDQSSRSSVRGLVTTGLLQLLK